jgi:putative ABC transport system permease protein
VFRVSLRNVMARKGRLLATALAVFLGVAFLAGALVLTDTIGRTFDDLFAQVNEGTDAQVRSAEVLETDFGDLRGRIDASLLELVRAQPEVADAALGIEGFAQVVAADGDPIGSPGAGPPTIGFNWVDVAALNPMRIVDGRPPGRGEVLIDRGAAKSGDLAVGDRVSVILQVGVREFTVSGIATFGTADNAGGATLTFFDEVTAAEVLGEPGKVNGIAVVAADGVSQDQVRDALADALAEVAGVEVITGEELTEETQDAIAEALAFFDTFLLIFAGVALFVGAFIIYNTFSIVVAQRTQELGLLRALGASRPQVLLSVQVEALVVGVVASVAGLAAGIGVATALKALLAAFGLDIPASGIVLQNRTIVAALVTGVVVTLVSAVAPAVRAGRVSPLAAMRQPTGTSKAQSRGRAVVGTLITAAGVGLIALGLFGDSGNAGVNVGLGGALVFLGVAALAPILARPVTGVLGLPIRRFAGVPGRLAVQNVRRNPKRTASSAAALMIGVGLVGFITVFAASATASIGKIIDDTFVGDFVVDSGSFGFGGLPPELADRLNELPEVEAASGLRFAFAEIDGNSRPLRGIDPATFGELVDIGVVAGSLADLGVDGLAVRDDVAADNGWTVGSAVPVRFVATGEQTLVVRAVFTEGQLVGSHVLGRPAFDANVPDQFDVQVYVLGADDVDTTRARAAVEAVADGYPNATVQDLTEFKDAQAGQINQLLGLVYVLLALSVVIAVIGIANTLVLSVVERTRELGLLRAVGMTRDQLRSAIRWEAVVIAVFGALLGMVIAVFFGWALVAALADDGFSELRIPLAQLLVIVVVAGLFGVLAAALPARRAARLDVLRAIGHE